MGHLVLYADERVGAECQYRVIEAGVGVMRVPDDILHCVAFLGYDGDDGRHQAGTAFILAKALDISDRIAVYVVTAKHVIDGIRRRSIDGKVYIRMNARAGGATHVASDVGAWVSDPDDPFLDVAILPWAPPADILEYRTIPESMVATDEVIRAEGIGVGDNIFLTGLFVNHYGKHRNIPIVRVGSIAAMPSEPVPINFFGTWASIDAYLVEVRSIGGLSGSPVFVMTRDVRALRILSDGKEIIGGPRFYLVGLMHGHFDARLSEADAVAPDEGRADAINTGIGMVVPASKIVGVTNLPELVAARRQIEDELRRATLPTLGAPNDNDKE